MKHINLTILSKNRPSQLDLLFRGFQKFCPWLPMKEIKVVWTETEDCYLEGYKRLWEMYPQVTEKSEILFKMDFLDLQDFSRPLTVVFCDDCVIQRPWSPKDQEIERLRHGDILCVSLALGENINWLYERQTATCLPDFGPFHDWDWKGADVDWNYPMSVMGNVFRTADIEDKFKRMGYSAAWNLESELVRNVPPRPRMTCYDLSRIVEVPANNVSMVPNKRGDQSERMINERWLNGSRIKYPEIQNNSIHYEYQFEFEPFPFEAKT